MQQRVAAFCALALAVVFFTAAPAMAETCEYDTPWGVMVMDFNWSTNSVIGHYAYKNGTFSGTFTSQSTIEGTWFQNDGNGYFVFSLHQTGFSGRWRYAHDRQWRGQWHGTLRGCY